MTFHFKLALLPLGEGWGEGKSEAPLDEALTPTLSRRERGEPRGTSARLFYAGSRFQSTFSSSQSLAMSWRSWLSGVVRGTERISSMSNIGAPV